MGLQSSKSLTFKVGEKVVYPAHGVGEITNIETQDISGTQIQVYVISFPQDKMLLRVLVNRAEASGLRKLFDKDSIHKIYDTLQSKPRPGNKMWSRKAQECEDKINSGNPISIAEVVRDLHKNVDSDRSYSERVIYESAVNRLASELALLENISIENTITKLRNVIDDKIAA